MEGIYELTILMPVLNEEETLKTCIQKAKEFLGTNNIIGEILIADNGSIDNSLNICKEEEVRVVFVENKGYGNALREGIKSSKGKYIIFADADNSYNFLEILPILNKLREGYDIVIGDRYKGKLEKNAMPFLHKNIGTPLISILGRFIYNSNVKDFNCGLRGMVTEKVQKLNFESTGMEFATEMIIKAEQANLNIINIPINYYKDSRINAKPHLNTFKDGMKHLKVILFHKKKNNLLKYIVLFILTVLCLLTLLVGVTSIPYKYIEKNILESAEFLDKENDIKEELPRRDYTFIHYYADAMTLSIIYSLDEEKGLTSSLKAMYYHEKYREQVHALTDQLKGELEPNDEYLRYWHGNIVIVKFLLIFFNIEQMYVIMKIIIYLLAIITLVMLWRRYKALSVVMFISFIAIYLPTVPMCLEYSWIFILMFLSIILGIKLNEKNKNLLGILFFIIGILTCFFDFFTNEIITILVPILIILLLDYKNNKINSFSQGLMFLLKNSLIWFIGYCGMWCAKWGIASIVLDINALDYVIEKAKIRLNINDVNMSTSQMYLMGLYNNIHALYPINIIKKMSVVLHIIGGIILTIFLIIDCKNIKEKWFMFLLGIIAITPYIRYIVIINHSFRHYFFTFRTQIITIIALLMLIVIFGKKSKKFK